MYLARTTHYTSFALKESDKKMSPSPPLEKKEGRSVAAAEQEDSNDVQDEVEEDGDGRRGRQQRRQRQRMKDEEDEDYDEDTASRNMLIALHTLVLAITFWEKFISERFFFILFLFE